MKVIRITSEDKLYEEFERFQHDHADSNFFQSGTYFQFVSGIKNFDPLLFICVEDQGRIVGSLLAVNHSEKYKFLRFLTTRTIISGGPLVSSTIKNRDQVVTSILQELIQHTRKEAPIIQFRNFSNLSEYIHIFSRFGFRYEDHLNLMTNTVTYSGTWSGLSSNRKRQIKKSLKNGASIVDKPTLKEYQQFYLILKNLYNLKVQKPLPNWSFFEKFFYSSQNETIGIIHLVKYQEKIIGGIMCPMTSEKVLHEWYVCGLDKKYNPEGIFPSTLATWSALEYASRNNIALFDFMGMGHPKSEYGVRDFKVRFGGKLVNYGRFERINNIPLYALSYVGYKIYYYFKHIYTRISRVEISQIFTSDSKLKRDTAAQKPGCIVVEGHVQGLANTRALGRAGIPVYIVDSKNNIGKYSKYCRKYVQCPEFNSSEFATFLLDLARKDGLNGWMILPSNDHALLSLSSNKKELEKFYRIITPDYDTVQKICVKTNLIGISERLGIGVPKTYFFSDLEKSGYRNFSYPVLTKGNESLSFYKKYRKKAFVSESPEEFYHTMKSLEGHIPLELTFTQEIIPTNGENKTLSFTAFAVKGDIKTYWIGKKLREHPIKFGTATYCESVLEERLIKPSRIILKELNYTGVCEIEYLKDPRDDDYKIIEINARTWLWVDLAIKSGINFPVITYNYLNNIDQEYPKEYVPGLKWMNYLTDFYFSIKAIGKNQISVSSYLRSFNGKIYSAVFSWSDPMPFFRMITMLYYIARNRLF